MLFGSFGGGRRGGAGPRHAIARGLSLLLLGTASLLPAGAVAQFPGEVHGRVLDARTGEGVAGARVEVASGGPGALSEGDGRFRLRGLEEGEVRVRAARVGYLPAAAEVRIRNGEETRLLLRMEPDPWEVAGIRVDARPSAAGPGVVLDRDAVRSAGARSLAELLEGLPGVVVVQRGPGGPASLQIRGGAGDHVLVLVDGLRINDPVTGRADLALVPLEGVVRVEVLPGALGARFGPGALAGVVRVFTGEPVSATELSAHLGSLGGFGGAAAFTRNRGTAGLEAGLEADRAAGAFDYRLPDEVGGGGGRRTNADHRRVGGHLALRGPFARGAGRLRVRTERLERGLPGRGFAPADSARQSDERIRLTGAWEGSASAGGPRVGLGVEGRSVRFRDPAPPLGLPFDDRTRLLAADFVAELGREPSLPALGLLGAGAELRLQRVSSDALTGPGTFGSARASIRAHGESAPAPVASAPVVAGAIALDADPDGVALTHDLALRGSSGPVRWHLAHRSARSPPSLADQFFREGVGVAPNPDLRPERIRGELEGGAALVLTVPGGDLFLSGAAFRADLKDMIVWSPDFRFVWSPRNRDVRRRGGELRAELRLGSGARISGHWTRAEVTYADDPAARRVQVVYRPRDSGALRAGLERARWRAELAARYTGVRYPVPARVNALHPFWTVEATLAGSFRTDGWEVRPLLRVDRLFDERDAFIFAVPEPGRTVRAEVRLRKLP